MSTEIIVTTDLPLERITEGKVRDIYATDNRLLLVATDRISAFDYVLPTPIPNKGICLTQLSAFWFSLTTNIVQNHLISLDFSEFPESLKPFRKDIEFRSMLVKKTKVLPVECIVRGYLSGSAWKSYVKDGTVCGMNLPTGLQESEQFDQPLFTPSTKAKNGHDENISFDQMKTIIGSKIADQLRDFSLSLYEYAAGFALKKGLIIADTKFEFGVVDGTILLIDEVFTPDSSRFWPADYYEIGKSQPSFDKQYVRDYLHSTGWDKNSPPPILPEHVVQETQRKYQELYERVTEKQFVFT
jgi:phosphoribosylaminoimidazole-succinocarboxamide synthase